METFVAAFRKRFEAQSSQEDVRTAKANAVARQEILVGNVVKALVAVPGSVALSAGLAREEATLAKLRGELEALAPVKPRVPHTAAIAAYVQKLQQLITDNPLEAATALKRALRPFRVRRNLDGTWTLNGAPGFCDSKSSGGVLRTVRADVGRPGAAGGGSVACPPWTRSWRGYAAGATGQPR